MAEIVYELICDGCGADYQINYVDNNINDYVEEPIYCPFCGTDVDLSDIDDGEELQEYAPKVEHETK